MADTTGSENADEARRRKAAARKEKILNRGSDRLARITSTARGEDGQKLWDSVYKIVVQRQGLMHWLR